VERTRDRSLESAVVRFQSLFSASHPVTRLSRGCSKFKGQHKKVLSSSLHLLLDKTEVCCRQCRKKYSAKTSTRITAMEQWDAPSHSNEGFLCTAAGSGHSERLHELISCALLVENLPSCPRYAQLRVDNPRFCSSARGTCLSRSTDLTRPPCVVRS